MLLGPKSLIPALVLLLSTHATAGPFGLEQGMSLEQLDANTESVAAGKYILKSVPNPNPAFEQYIVQLGPQTGLCWIKAISKDIETNPYGYQLKSNFARLRDVVEAVYGDHLIIDRLIYGSKYDQPVEWMQGLINEERLLAAFWDRGNGSSLPKHLTSIDLVASPVSAYKGFVAIEYSFSNEATCDAEWLATADDLAP